MSDTANQFERVDLATIHQDPRNARLHNDRNLEAIKRALHRFGQQKPIVVGRSNRTIYAGNGTHRAAIALGWTHLWVSWSDLSPEEAAAYAVADNRTAELAQWDDAQLMSLAQELDDATLLDALGFDAGEMDALLHASSALADSILSPPPPPAREEAPEQPQERTPDPGQGGITVTLLIDAPRPLWKRFQAIKTSLKTRNNAEALQHILDAYENV